MCEENNMERPQPDEYAPFYANYIGLVTESDVIAVLAAQLDEVLNVLRQVPEAESLVLHPPYTWTIKEVVGHLIDGERIFGYRALRFARGDSTPLPGFEENDYARAGEFNRIPLSELVAEFEAVRRAQLAFFRHLPNAAWSRGGTANGSPVTVRALAFMMAGHVRHHFAIVQRRLGKADSV
jgi:DinB superfamily